MTAAVTAPAVTGVERRFRAREIWRIVRLHAVNPSIFFGVPWLILAGAWAVTMVLAIIIQGAGAPRSEVAEGFRSSWAVLSPQWYLVVVGVQAIAYTFSFALGLGATRRDFWLGTGLMFLIVSVVNAIGIATLVQVEQATNGWGIGAHMFDALWYGQYGWLVDAYTTFALQLLVLFIGASITTVYMRWRVRGMMIFLFGGVAVVLAVIAAITFAEGWAALGSWLESIGVVGVFTIAFVKALAWAVVGYLVIRRATPR